MLAGSAFPKLLFTHAESDSHRRAWSSGCVVLCAKPDDHAPGSRSRYFARLICIDGACHQ